MLTQILVSIIQIHIEQAGAKLGWFHCRGVKHRCPTNGRGLLDKRAYYARISSSFLGPKAMEPLLLFIFHKTAGANT